MERIPPAHFGYLATGVDSDETLQANRDGFSRFQIKPRLVDVSEVNTTVNVLGVQADSPIFLCSGGLQGAYHSDAELELAERRLRKVIKIRFSPHLSTRIEDVAEARGAPTGTSCIPLIVGKHRFDVTASRKPRAPPLFVLRLIYQVAAILRKPSRDYFVKMIERWLDCHRGQAKPMFEGLDMRGARLTDPSLTWDVIGRI